MDGEVLVSRRKRAASLVPARPPHQPLRVCSHRRAAKACNAFLQIDEVGPNGAPGGAILENMKAPKPRGIGPVTGGWTVLRPIHCGIFHHLLAPSLSRGRRN